MKKSLLALAALGVFAGTASAQTSVTIYGIVDMGIVAESGGLAGTTTKLTSGVGSGTRLGFRGTEDLGGGLSANFVLETGIAADTGGFNQGGLAFGRQSYVGLKGNFGTLTAGRQYTPHFLVLTSIADPFGTGFAGNTGNIMATNGVRMNNTLKYATPNMNGFSADVAYGFGEVAGDTAASRAIGASAGYANGPVAIRLGYHNQNNAAATDNAKSTLLAGTYNFNVAKLHLAYDKNTGVGAIDNSELLIGATVPFGQSTFLASYIRKDDKTATNFDSNQFALGYLYALSKRTDLYVAYARMNNNATLSVANIAAGVATGTGFKTVGNSSEAGSGDKAWNFGIRHAF
jgi:predicted porin